MTRLFGDPNPRSENTFDPYNVAILLWCFYYATTEAYDRTLEGRWDPRDPECWIPYNAARSTRHARDMLSRLGGWIARCGIPKETSQAALLAVKEMRHSAQVEMAGRVKITEGVGPLDFAVEINGRLLRPLLPLID